MAERDATGAVRTIRRTGASVTTGFKQHAHSVMNTCLGHEMLPFAPNVHRIAAGAFANT